jgi:hypothetical protein
MREKCGKIWSTLTDDVRIGLLQTFRERLKKCFKTKGDIIKFNKVSSDKERK